MPIYQYDCLDCGHDFTDMHKWDEKPCPCPNCNSANLHRKIGAPSIRMGGIQSMSTRYTTSEYFGPDANTGRTTRLAVEQYSPEERTRKAVEQKKKEDSKGKTIIMPKTTKK